MKKLMISSLAVLMAIPAFAGGGNKADWLLDTYGGGTMLYVMDHAYTGTDACIGISHKGKNCGATWNFVNDALTEREYRIKWNYQYGTVPWFDERFYMMMIATQITENGAYFCPTLVAGRNNASGTWSEYHSLGHNVANCFWVCRDGYSGRQCQNYNKYETCDVTPIKHSTYDNLTIDDAEQTNIEDSVPMFVWNKYKSDEEHDMVLGVTRWLESGHGVFVQPVVVYIRDYDWSSAESSGVNVYPAGGSVETLMCKDGYRPQGDDCVPVNQQACLQAEGKMCEGWATGYDAEQHTLVKSVDSKKDCYEYRCKAVDHAFSTGSGRACAECPASLRQGVSAVDGSCVLCPVGEVFIGGAATSADAKMCGESYMLTKTDMMYGRDKQKSDVPNLSEQCWTKGSTDGYRDCVLALDSADASGAEPKSYKISSVPVGSNKFMVAPTEGFGYKVSSGTAASN